MASHSVCPLGPPLHLLGRSRCRFRRDHRAGDPRAAVLLPGPRDRQPRGTRADEAGHGPGARDLARATLADQVAAVPAPRSRPYAPRPRVAAAQGRHRAARPGRRRHGRGSPAVVVPARGARRRRDRARAGRALPALIPMPAADPGRASRSDGARSAAPRRHDSRCRVAASAGGRVGSDHHPVAAPVGPPAPVSRPTGSAAGGADGGQPTASAPRSRQSTTAGGQRRAGEQPRSRRSASARCAVRTGPLGGGSPAPRGSDPVAYASPADRGRRRSSSARARADLTGSSRAASSPGVAGRRAPDKPRTAPARPVRSSPADVTVAVLNGTDSRTGWPTPPGNA